MDVGIWGRGVGGVVIFMSLLYYMFQSILNTFGFGYFFDGKKLIIFTDGGYPPPFVENSAKIINLILEPFPNQITEKYSIPSKLFEVPRTLL